MQLKKFRSRAAFTLVEIMIVVAIIGLLAAIAVPNLLRAREKTQLSLIQNNLRLIDNAKQSWALENNQPGNKTSLAEALKRAAPLIKRKGTLVVLSDFFDEPEAVFKALNQYLHRGFRVHLFHVLDPAELNLPDRGLSRFVDVETGDRLVVHTQTMRDAWKAEMRRHTQTLGKLAASRQVDYAVARTTDSWFKLFDRLA